MLICFNWNNRLHWLRKGVKTWWSYGVITVKFNKAWFEIKKIWFYSWAFNICFFLFNIQNCKWGNFSTCTSCTKWISVSCKWIAKNFWGQSILIKRGGGWEDRWTSLIMGGSNLVSLSLGMGLTNFTQEILWVRGHCF